MEVAEKSMSIVEVLDALHVFHVLLHTFNLFYTLSWIVIQHSAKTMQRLGTVPADDNITQIGLSETGHQKISDDTVKFAAEITIPNDGTFQEEDSSMQMTHPKRTSLEYARHTQIDDGINAVVENYFKVN